MIYQKALKEFNGAFKINIKPQPKVPSIASLIKQIQCQHLTSNDFALIQQMETAQKPLQKLVKLLTTLQNTVNQNEKTRQQQNTKQIDYTSIQNMEYLFAECKQINTKEQFINFIKEKRQKLCENSSNYQLFSKNYKQIHICKEIQYYSNITLINEEQYFKLLQQSNQKLGVLLQSALQIFKSKQRLQSFNGKLQRQELFTKKDNIVNQIINYNLAKTLQLTTKLDQINKLFDYYRQSLSFSLTRIYYILNLCNKQINWNKLNFSYLQEIKKFISEKPQFIFIKFYQNIINEPLIKLQYIRQNFIKSKFESTQLSSEQKQKIINKIQSIQTKLKNNSKNNDTQLLFQQIFQDIQNTFIKVQLQLYKSDNSLMNQLKQSLIKCQSQCIKLLKTQNDRISGSWRKSNTSYGSKKCKSNRSQYLQIIQQICQPSQIFDYNKIKKQPKNTNFTTKIQNNQKLYQQSCLAYLKRIQPNFGQSLEDNKNFQPEQLKLLIQSAQSPEPPITKLLQQIQQNLIKPEITQTNLYKIFSPTLRFKQLKKFHNLLTILNQKVINVINNSLYNDYQQNVQKFIINRNKFLTVVTQQIQKIIQIAQKINQIKLKKQYDVCNNQSYQYFLKILLAYKEVKTYYQSFQDQKNISKTTHLFVNKKIYQPLQQILRYRHPQIYTDVKQLQQVVGDLQFFQKFINDTKQLTERFIMRIQNQVNKTSRQETCNEFVENIKKNTQQCKNYLNRRNLFNYQQAQKKITKLLQIIKACQKAKKQELKDPTAIKIAKILQKKL